MTRPQTPPPPLTLVPMMPGSPSRLMHATARATAGQTTGRVIEVPCLGYVVAWLEPYDPAAQWQVDLSDTDWLYPDRESAQRDIDHHIANRRAKGHTTIGVVIPLTPGYVVLP